MNYTVAVIIPTLNEEKYIAKCLDCVIDQTFPFDEMDVMVIDGGSSDNTEAIVSKYIDRYPNIRFVHNPRKIQSIAFNIGMKLSDAPYIVRLDAHALYQNDYVNKCIDSLKSDNKMGNVGGRCNILPSNDTIWGKANAILNYSRFGIGGSAFRVGTRPNDVDSVPFGTFPRAVLTLVGGMREDLRRGEDNEINSRIRKAGYRVYFDPSIVSSYYARPTLSSSCKQMFANGESIGHLFYVDKKSIGLRHLVPFFFVIALIIGISGAFINSFVLYTFLMLIGLYLLCDFCASVIASRYHGWDLLIPLFILFFCVHVSYGIGTIVGLSTGKKLKESPCQ